ncbi:MAG: hypothetical protein RLZZ303_38 [Candidatus Hydrogenedentota bacterium]|jgi:hypothetical protein
MKAKPSTYPLRMPASLKAAVTKLSKDDGSSINQFVVMAVAEKVSALGAEEYLRERAARADMEAFDRIMNRSGGAEPETRDRVE